MHEKVHESDYWEMQELAQPLKQTLTESLGRRGACATNRHGHQRRLRSLQVGHVGDARAHAVRGQVIR